MKITPKQYAKSLYETVENKKDSQAKEVIKKFTAILADNNDITRADQIIAKFEELWNKEKGIVKAEIVSARELDKKIVKWLNDYIIKLSKAGKLEMTSIVDKNILGGVVIKYRDKIIDGSLKARLSKLERKMVK